jgi:alpha-tubulin suppressor-like RCC1 family protein
MISDTQQDKGTEQKGIEPTEVAALDDVKNIKLGLAHACAVLYSGRVKCWGGNANGELGNGETSDMHVTRPIEVMGLPQ